MTEFLYAGLLVTSWEDIIWEFSSKILLNLKELHKNESLGSLNSKSTGICESFTKVIDFAEGLPSVGVEPKSILEFYIFTFGMIIFAFNGNVSVFPPLIKKETVESIFIEENPWILNIISCIPYDNKDPLIGDAVTRF